MIIEFSVKNFRSFKERQTLSMVASNKRDKNLKENLLEPNLPGLSKIRLLKSVVVYGANASGKSNLIKAIYFLKNFVVDSATTKKPNDETGVVPFKLDSESVIQPSEFEMIFIHEGIRYQYGVVLDKNQVYEEWLLAYTSRQAQTWFERKYDLDRNEYAWKFSTYLKGEKESLKEKTRNNISFLSVAAQFNHEQLLDVYYWFTEHLRFIDFSDSFFSSEGVTAKLLQYGEIKNLISLLIREADIGISDIQVFKKEPKDMSLPPFFTKEMKNQFFDDLKWDIHTIHKTSNNNNVIFSIDEESEGTKKLFSLLAPWLITLTKGQSIFVDEISAMMHPLLVRGLIQLFHKDYFNKSGAQLIFTSHDSSLLDSTMFRRDQIWFTEKDNDGGTILYPLTDYKPRNDESLQKGYLAGRYGAIPFLTGDLALK